MHPLSQRALDLRVQLVLISKQELHPQFVINADWMSLVNKSNFVLQLRSPSSTSIYNYLPRFGTWWNSQTGERVFPKQIISERVPGFKGVWRMMVILTFARPLPRISHAHRAQNQWRFLIAPRRNKLLCRANLIAIAAAPNIMPACC